MALPERFIPSTHAVRKKPQKRVFVDRGRHSQGAVDEGCCPSRLMTFCKFSVLSCLPSVRTEFPGAWWQSSRGAAQPRLHFSTLMRIRTKEGPRPRKKDAGGPIDEATGNARESVPTRVNPSAAQRRLIAASSALLLDNDGEGVVACPLSCQSLLHLRPKPLRASHPRCCRASSC